MRLLLILFIFISCTSTKKVATTTNETSESKTVNIDSIVKVKSDSLRLLYEEKQRQFETGVIFMNTQLDSLCQMVINELQAGVLEGDERADSLLQALRKIIRPVNVIKVNRDGSFEASGQIQSFNLKISEWQKRYDLLKLEKERIDSVNKKLSEENKSLAETRNVDKKTKFLTNWWIYLLFFAGGMALMYKLKK